MSIETPLPRLGELQVTFTRDPRVPLPRLGRSLRAPHNGRPKSSVHGEMRSCFSDSQFHTGSVLTPGRGLPPVARPLVTTSPCQELIATDFRRNPEVCQRNMSMREPRAVITWPHVSSTAFGRCRNRTAAATALLDAPRNLGSSEARREVFPHKSADNNDFRHQRRLFKENMFIQRCDSQESQS